MTKWILEESELTYGLPENRIIHGNASTVLKKFPPNSVDCVITSPPYWVKRDYGDETITEWEDGTKYQLGLEPTPELYVEHLIQIFRQIKRVLKPHGNVFVVIDDTYCGGGHGGVRKDGELKDAIYVGRNTCPVVKWSKVQAPRKSLCLVPELFAIRMVYELGFILRQKIIWAKKVLVYKEEDTIGNAMPESVKDRQTHTYEYIYHFVKEPKYYYDQFRLPLKEETIGRMERAKKLIERTGLPITPNNKYYQALLNSKIEEYGQAGILTGRYLKHEDRKYDGLPECHPLGANSPDVIQINTEPLKDSHYAPFPTKLVEFLIKVGCPEQVCKKCGKPRERVVEKVTEDAQDKRPDRGQIGYPQKQRGGDSIVYAIGWTDCGCGAGFEPGIVLDPFLGSGTTALVALKMNRKFVGIELNREYCEMALKRIKPYLHQTKLWAFDEMQNIR